MFRAILLLTVAVALLLGSSSNATILDGPIVNPANGHQYILLGQASWTASEAEAVTLGGHLATVNDAAEDLWLYQTFAVPEERNLWIGLNDNAVEGTFVWVDGDLSPYRHWDSAEPNNHGLNGRDEDAVHIIGAGNSSQMWNDLSRNPDPIGTYQLPHGIVEIVPEPSTALLLASGLATLAVRRRQVGPRGTL